MNSKEKIILPIIIIYEIIDVILFILSVLIPIIFIDFMEIFIGLFLDCFILYYLYDDKDIGVYGVGFFFLEALVILDLVFLGTEVLGWTALIPFWYIGYIFLKDTTPNKKVVMPKPKEKENPKKYCPACKELVRQEQIVCEKCGTLLSH